MTNPNAQNRSADEREIRALERAYDQAWSAGDIGRVMTLFTPDAAVITPYGRIARGAAEIDSVLRSYLTGEGLNTTHSSTVTMVHLISPDVAIVDGEATIEKAAPPGVGIAPLITHTFTDVIVKREGAWRICQVRAYTFME